MSHPWRFPKTFQVDESVLASQKWILAHRLLAANPELEMRQVVDPFDGDSLLLRNCRDPLLAVSLNSARGIEVLAARLFAPIPWEEAFALPRGEILRRLGATTGWSTIHSKLQSEQAIRAGLIANLLATLSLTEDDWWVRCLDADVLDGPPPIFEGAFAGLASAAVRDFEESCVAGRTFSAPWVLHRDAAPLVAFDSHLQIWIPGGSLKMASLLDDLHGDLGELAGQVLKYLR